ncbi:hypothetical protein CY35_14G044700 [Sphagnum magellanicum]|nr:hypothetical protein CY35_14G044700 [Sphagnum magellanicum]
MKASLASSSLACGLSKLVVATTILPMKTCTLMSHTPVGGSRDNAFFNSCLLHLQSIVVFSWKEFHCPGLLFIMQVPQMFLKEDAQTKQQET